MTSHMIYVRNEPTARSGLEDYVQRLMDFRDSPATQSLARHTQLWRDLVNTYISLNDADEDEEIWKMECDFLHEQVRNELGADQSGVIPDVPDPSATLTTRGTGQGRQTASNPADRYAAAGSGVPTQQTGGSSD